MTHNRAFSDLTSEAGPAALDALTRLADAALPAGAYGDAMLSVGRALERCFAQDRGLEGKAVYVAITVEDADYLAAGIAEVP